jgi:hypothetical protein
MSRRSIFAWWSTLFAQQRAQTPEPSPVLIDVGAGKSVTITLRSMEKAQLAAVIADLLTKREQAQNPRLRSLLAQAGIVTLILTTGRERVTPAVDPL